MREEQHAIKIRTEQQQSFAFRQREVQVRFKLTRKQASVIHQGVWKQISVKPVKVCFHQIYIQPFTFAEHGFDSQRGVVAQVDCGQ